ARVLLEPAPQRRMVAKRALGLAVRGFGRRRRTLARLGRLGLRLLRVRLAGRLDARQLRSDRRELVFASGGITFGFGGVVADDEASAVVAVEADLLDTQVVAHGLVAALAGQRLVGELRALAHLD